MASFRKAILRLGPQSRALIPGVFRASYAVAAAGDDDGRKSTANIVAQMVEYAASFKKDGESGYISAARVLEQGLSFANSSGDSASLCKLQFAIGNLHADHGKMQDAVEAFQSVANNSSTPLELKVSAMEALTGLHLQMHQDELASSQVQALSELGGKASDAQVKALSGLIKLSEAAFDAAAACFESFPSDATQGTAILARAEVNHVIGDTEKAKEFYEAAAKLAEEESSKSKLPGGVTTTPEEVHSAALAGLGQLLTDLEQFDEAEKHITAALQIAEGISGESHARVGLVLSCMADLYSRRAKVQSTGYMISEGLYRRSLNLLKAPAIDKESSDPIRFLDAVALTQARYADILSSVEQRASEGKKLRSWADTVWKNKRSLADVLQASSSANRKRHSLVDVRLGRVF